MKRLPQDAADELQWHERQARHKQGYGPRPSEMPAATWLLTLTEAEKKAQEKYIELHKCPF